MWPLRATSQLNTIEICTLTTCLLYNVKISVTTYVTSAYEECLEPTADCSVIPTGILKACGPVVGALFCR